jgi:hypothetical protein
MQHEPPKPRIKNLEPYRWASYVVGDSQLYRAVNPAALRSSLSKYAKSSGRQFVTSARQEGDISGVRVWRVA